MPYSPRIVVRALSSGTRSYGGEGLPPSAPPDGTEWKLRDTWINTTSGQVYERTASGFIETINIKGPAGAMGPTGPSGSIGPTGPAGVGQVGPAGATGIQGLVGPQGPAGSAGAVGATGPQGPSGLQGATGPSGLVGATGPIGPSGPSGSVPKAPVLSFIATASKTLSSTGTLGLAGTETSLIPTGLGGLILPSALFDTPGLHFVFKAAGTYSNAVAGALTLKVKLSSQVSLQIAALALPAVTNRLWFAEGLGTVRPGRILSSHAVFNFDDGTTKLDGAMFSSSLLTISAGDKTADMTGQWNLNIAAAQFTVEQMTLGYIPPPVMPAKESNGYLLWIIAALATWNGWMSVQLISMQSEVKSATLTHSNVIPPVVESALAELRTRLNNDQGERAKLLETAIENRGDVGRLKQDVTALKMLPQK